jgi:hypothetical protein
MNPLANTREAEGAAADRQEAAAAADTPGEAAAASTRAASVASDLNLETILHMFTPVGIYFFPHIINIICKCIVYSRRNSLKSL